MPKWFCGQYACQLIEGLRWQDLHWVKNAVVPENFVMQMRSC